MGFRREKKVGCIVLLHVSQPKAMILLSIHFILEYCRITQCETEREKEMEKETVRDRVRDIKRETDIERQTE